jgi:sugar lactone lactonase YvrE
MANLRVKTLLLAVLALVIMSSTMVNASSPSKGMRGSEGEILSEVTTYAGSGAFAEQDGEALNAAFRTPLSLVALPDGSVFVADSRNQTIRRIAAGEVATYAGLTLELNELGLPVGGWNDDEREEAVFNAPSGITADLAGNLYIADAENHRVRKISSEGKVTTLAGDGIIGSEDGTGEEARLYQPQDVAVAMDGTIYVADTLNHLIRKISRSGKVTTLNSLSDRAVQVVEGSVETAGDYKDGALADAKFNEPSGLAIDSKGNLYVSDTGNQLIRYIDLKAGTVVTVAGLVPADGAVYAEDALYAAGDLVDGSALEAAFNFPKGIVVTGEGGLLIADSLNHSVRYLFEGQVSTIAGDADASFGLADGINGHNQLHNPTDVTILADGSILIADSYNHLIRQFSLYRLPADLPLNDQVKVVYGENVIAFDTAPELIDGRTMVPVRALSEEMGYSVEYSAMDQAVSLTKADVRIEFHIGDSEMIIDLEGSEEQVIKLDAATYIRNKRTYVPLRFFSEEFGLDVQWNQNNKTVILRDKNE